MKEQKAALIEAIYQQIASNRKSREQFKKEFKVDDMTFEKIVRRLLDTWLDSPELIMFLSEALGVYAAGGAAEEGEEGEHDYLG